MTNEIKIYAYKLSITEGNKMHDCEKFVADMKGRKV